MIWWAKYAGVINPLVSLLDLRNRRPFPNYRPLQRLSLRLLGQQPRGSGFHLINLALSIINLAIFHWVWYSKEIFNSCYPFWWRDKMNTATDAIVRYVVHSLRTMSSWLFWRLISSTCVSLLAQMKYCYVFRPNPHLNGQMCTRSLDNSFQYIYIHIYIFANVTTELVWPYNWQISIFKSIIGLPWNSWLQWAMSWGDILSIKCQPCDKATRIIIKMFTVLSLVKCNFLPANSCRKLVRTYW